MDAVTSTRFVFLRLVLLVTAVATLHGCLVDRRSDEFRCAVPTDCAYGRTCELGWCVVSGSQGPDGGGGGVDGAPQPTPDGAVSTSACDPTQCTECDASGTCVIRCDTVDSCSSQVVQCQADVPCRVECTGLDSCDQSINCQAASSCEILCTGDGSCSDSIQCGSGPCNVTCTGITSCRSRVECEDSCACDTTCSDFASCAFLRCPGNTCRVDGECSSIADPSCNTCGP